MNNNKKYLLASHNSFSYRKPMNWWMRPFNIFSRCQSKDLRAQYDAGVRVFDIRLRLYKDGFYITHGIMKYAKWVIAFFEIYDLCYKASVDKEKLYFRFLLEYNQEPKHKDEIRQQFLDEVSYFFICIPRQRGVWCPL